MTLNPFTTVLQWHPSIFLFLPGTWLLSFLVYVVQLLAARGIIELLGDFWKEMFYVFAYEKLKYQDNLEGWFFNSDLAVVCRLQSMRLDLKIIETTVKRILAVFGGIQCYFPRLYESNFCDEQNC